MHCKSLNNWLFYTGRYADGLDNFTKGLAQVLNESGFDISRLNLGVYILHPDIAGVAFQWLAESGKVVQISVEHEDLQSPIYLQSPIRECVDFKMPIRARLLNADEVERFPVFEEFAEDGMTDYCALPLPGAADRINVWSVATTNPNGFSQAQWEALQEFSLYLSLVVDYLAVQWLAGVLMQVYLGRRTGKRVLAGQVRRGDGQRIKAALWYCDMRNFTELSTTMQSEDLIVLLNEYFGKLGPAVRSEDGEILKFIGDSMLAIFPVGEQSGDAQMACGRCLSAAHRAQAYLEHWAEQRIKNGKPAIRSGIAMHIGEVLYGNIGAEGRLDFTVIGEAVNRVARVEGMCRSLGEQLLATKEFVSQISNSSTSLGSYTLKGIDKPVEIFRMGI